MALRFFHRHDDPCFGQDEDMMSLPIFRKALSARGGTHYLGCNYEDSVGPSAWATRFRGGRTTNTLLARLRQSDPQSLKPSSATFKRVASIIKRKLGTGEWRNLSYSTGSDDLSACHGHVAALSDIYEPVSIGTTPNSVADLAMGLTAGFTPGHHVKLQQLAKRDADEGARLSQEFPRGPSPSVPVVGLGYNPGEA